MNKKAISAATMIGLILVAIVILIMVSVAIYPQIKGGKRFFQTIGGKCKETGITLDDYLIEIELLLEDFDSTGKKYKTSGEKAEKEKEIVDLYKEFKDCFPDSGFEAYMESLNEREVFNFIFVLKEQKYYDKTTLKISNRYVNRFPTNRRISEVNSYINQAKAAT